MAQQRLRDYQSPLGSFLHNLTNLGIHKPGRFCGYDTLVQSGQLQFSLTHQNSGINTASAVGDPYGPLGVMISNQGEILMEDAPITGLTIETNTGNAFARLDLVVLNHQYIQLANPASANYSIVKGILGDGQLPGILGQFQTIVGRISIPAGATLISQCTYTKAPCPDSGDGPDAKLLSPNIFKTINVNGAELNTLNNPTETVNGISNWAFPITGNTFVIAPAANVNLDTIGFPGLATQYGMEINLVINGFVRVRDRAIHITGNPTFLPITFAQRLSSGTDIVNGVSVNVLQPPQGQINVWILSMILISTTWYIKSIDGPGFNTGTFIKGMTMEVTMLLAEAQTNFDGNGSGIGIWGGWQILNGFNDLPDRRGKYSIGATNIPAPFPFPGPFPAWGATTTDHLNPQDVGGSFVNFLSKAQLPQNGLQILIPGGGEGYVYDGNGGGSKLSLKGDNDQGTGAGRMTTEAMGNGAPIPIAPPYYATFWVVKL